MFIPSNHVWKKKTREIDLLQSYVSNPSLVTLVYIAHLPLDLQSFIMTPSFSLRLCLLEQTEHSPMRPIPNFNIIVELAQGVIMRMEATTKGKGRKQGKKKFSTSPLTILPCKCCQMIMTLEFFYSGNYVLQDVLLFAI